MSIGFTARRRWLLAWLALPCLGTLPTAAAAWTDADIDASRTQPVDLAPWPNRPSWPADPNKLFVVIEAGAPQLTLIDGERFERFHQLPSRPGPQGPPAFTPDGRFAYLATQDGWISKYDLWNLRIVTEVRAALRLGNIALSSDGLWLIAAGQSPHRLLLFDAELRRVRSWAAASRDGQRSSAVAAVYDAALRRSFVVALRDVGEIWEISYDPRAEDIYEGLVHDFRMGEGVPMRGFHNAKRSFIAAPMEHALFDSDSTHMLGNAAGSTQRGGQVVNLDVRRRIATLPVTDLPQAGAGLSFLREGARLLAAPSRSDSTVEVIDMATWKSVKSIPLGASGAFVSSHESTALLWAGMTTADRAADTLTLIDKRGLVPVAHLRENGRALVQVAFSLDGRHALVSAGEDDGAIIVYDSTTLRVLKRLPMQRPLGAYSVGNRLARGAIGAR